MAADAAHHVWCAVCTLAVARGRLRRARGARAAGVLEAHLEDAERRLRALPGELAGAAVELDVVALRRWLGVLEQCGEAVVVASGLRRCRGSRLLRAEVASTSDRIAQAKACVSLLARRAWEL